MEYFARSEGFLGKKQLVREHLKNVADLTGQFAEEAGLPRAMGEWAGWLHDLGKYSDEFQRHLARQDGDLVEHAAHGALLALKASALECAFAVSAHHAGLGTPGTLKELASRDEKTASLSPRQTIADRAATLLERAIEDGFVSGQAHASVPAKGTELQFELRTRVLLSCLADADRLDAERWMDQYTPYLRTTTEVLNPGVRLERTLEHIAGLNPAQRVSDVIDVRTEVLQAALSAAATPSGFFSLTVPTGGGKTLASLAFALAHAARHGQRRIIFVVPFLTVIEQNAGVIRAAVGDAGEGRAVLEHHSNVVTQRDADSEPRSTHDIRQRLLAENWDAPIIITTAVQFFESLFSNHPTQVRKIHNIANSVVVFDEAQAFPPKLLRPLVGMLRQLVDEYRCTAVFATATQPALTNSIRGADGEREPLLPLGSLREIAVDPAELFRRLKRAQVTWPGDERTPFSAIAAAMARDEQALAVVNTKQQARELLVELRTYSPAAIHLSTRMCAAHRRAAVAEIRRRLRVGEPCLVASTQLVEAGVDVDFPAVWRAFGPLDSIAQAAGRCNREGKLPQAGAVTVFRPEDDRMPPGVYRRATDVTGGMLKMHVGAIDIHAPESFSEYFIRLYNSSDLDAKGVVAARRSLNFPAVAEKFKLIKETTTGVLVPYGEGAEWIERLGAGEDLRRSQVRQMQPFMVSLYEGELQVGLNTGAIAVDTKSGIHIFRKDYDDTLGLVLPVDDPLEH